MASNFHRGKSFTGDYIHGRGGRSGRGHGRTPGHGHEHEFTDGRHSVKTLKEVIRKQQKELLETKQKLNKHHLDAVCEKITNIDLQFRVIGGSRYDYDKERSKLMYERDICMHRIRTNDFDEKIESYENFMRGRGGLTNSGLGVNFVRDGDITGRVIPVIHNLTTNQTVKHPVDHIVHNVMAVNINIINCVILSTHPILFNCHHLKN